MKAIPKLLLLGLLPALLTPDLQAQTPEWHFEFEDGRPVKLVWQTQPGRSYYLRETDDLLSWSPAPGFPKRATGTSMEHLFVPGLRGFFDIQQEGGGWQLAPLPALPDGSWYQIEAISSLSTSQVWASGSVKPSYDSFVIRTADGGRTWQQIFRAGGIGFFGDLRMITPEIGYVAGGGVRRTTDGGVTWPADPVSPDGYMYGMAAVDENHVWVGGWDGAGAGVIHHRVPERPGNPTPGSNWFLEWAMPNRAIYGIAAANASTAWAVGFAGFIWKTTDGLNWGPQTSNVGVSLNDIVAVDATTAWTVGDAGTILKTTDGGATWMAQTSGASSNLRRIAAANANVAWAVGEFGTILHTADGGNTWAPQFSGTTATLLAAAAADPLSAWVGGDGILLRTSDGGTGNWNAPKITSVSPNVVGEYSFPAVTVTISGSGFRGGNPVVTFGDAPAEGVTWISETMLQAVAPRGTTRGTVAVTVTNEDGQQATLPRAVTFVPTPILTHYSPLHGPAEGGYQITLDGYNLQSVNRATFYMPGSSETLTASVINPTRVVVTVPVSASRMPGPATLVLETAENQVDDADAFLLDPAGGPAFAVTSITPASGPVSPQITITVTGVGFTPETTLELCNRNLTITSRSATELIARAFGDPGLCRLRVANSESDLVDVDPAFLLTSGTLPTLANISPATGPLSGGTSVTLTGTGFQSGDTVTFGGYPAEITSRTATSMVVTIPPHASGTVSVFIMTDGLQRSAAVLQDAFTYQ